MNAQVQYLLDKLYSIDTELGGKSKTQKAKRKGDEYDLIKQDIQENLHKIMSKQDSRDEKEEKFGNKDNEVIRLNHEIRDLTSETDKLLTKMNEKLIKMSKNRKKYSDEVLQLKDQLFQNLRSQYETVMQRESNGFYDPENPPIQTLTEAKQVLYGQEAAKRNNPNQRYEAQGQELDAMRRWEKVDRQMDEKLDRIIDGTHAWKHKAKLMSDKIEEAHKLEQKLYKQVDKANKTASSQNAQLKKILVQYRKPNKFCMDMVLLCLFLGLIAIIYNMLKSGPK